MIGEPPSESPPPVHPPTAPPSVTYAPLVPSSKWSTGVGVVAIVFGALGLLSNCSGIAAPLFFDMSAGMLPPDQVSPIQTMQQYQTPTMIMSLLLTLLGIMLLAAGIGIVKRCRWAIKVSLWYAVLKIIATLLNAALAYVVQRAMFGAMQNQTPAMAGMGAGFFGAMGVVTVAITVAMGWAMPIFLLIWFGRAKIKAEVADWS